MTKPPTTTARERITAAEYAARAERFKPTTADGMRQAALDLAAQGLKRRDIADALRLPIDQVIELTNDTTTGERS